MVDHLTVGKEVFVCTERAYTTIQWAQEILGAFINHNPMYNLFILLQTVLACVTLVATRMWTLEDCSCLFIILSKRIIIQEIIATVYELTFSGRFSS